MKKFLLSDIKKALDEEDAREISRISRQYSVDINQARDMYNLTNDQDVTEDEAFYLTENWDGDPEWRDVIDTAFLLDTDIESIGDDDVENVMSGVGSKGEFDSDVGIVQWVYDNTIKAYLIYMALTNNSNLDSSPQEVLYRLDPEMMAVWQESSSKGLYYNNNIRGNTAIEDPELSCGCSPEPCSPEQLEGFKTQYDRVQESS
jgi:hypothetical protein